MGGHSKFDRERTFLILKKSNWDREIASKELGITRDCLRRRILRLKEEGFDVELSVAMRGRPMEYEGFPSNDERLEHKDNPRGCGAYNYKARE